MITSKKVIEIRVPRPKHQVIDAIGKRFSPRIFSSEPIPEEHLEVIFEAARLTPSARNLQQWFFYMIKKGTPAHKKIQQCIPDTNSWALTAPVIIVGCADTEVDAGSKWIAYDLGASVISLIFQAQSLGYYSRQIGYFDADMTKEIFNLPINHKPTILIAMGKIGTDNDYQKADEVFFKKDLDRSERKERVIQELIV